MLLIHSNPTASKVTIECYRQGSATGYADSDKFTVYVSVATAYKQLSKMDIEI